MILNNYACNAIMLWWVTVQLWFWRSSVWSSTKAERIANLMKKTKYFASRRETPWDSTLRDYVQEFIRNEYLDDYYEKHPALSDSNESSLLNAFVPVCCPNCGSLQFTRKGFTSNGIQRYCCKDCGKKEVQHTYWHAAWQPQDFHQWMDWILPQPFQAWQHLINVG